MRVLVSVGTIRTWCSLVTIIMKCSNNLRLSLDQAKSNRQFEHCGGAIIMSNDLRTLPDCYRDLLLNPEMIAIDQDTLGPQVDVLAIKQRQKCGADSLAAPLPLQ